MKKNKINSLYLLLPFPVLLILLCVFSCDLKVTDNQTEEEIPPDSAQVMLFAPTDVQIEQLSANSLKLSWIDNSWNEQGFKIDKKVGTASWITSYGIVDTNMTVWYDQDAENNILKYRVYAYLGEAKSDYAESEEFYNIISAPTNLVLSKPDETKIRLIWECFGEIEDGFSIDKKIGGLDWELNYAEVDSSITTYIDDIEYPCGTFSYRVRSYQNGLYSNYSNEEQINIRLDIISSTNTPGEATEVFFYNWYAFLSDKYSGLSIVNCVNPSNPVINTYNQGGLPDRTSSVFIRDEVCYVSSHGAINDPGMFYLIDVSPFINDPTQPLPDVIYIIGSCETNGIPKDIFVYGDYSFIADGDGGLSTIICSGPPHSISNISINGDARNIYIKNSYAFIANGLNGGLVILDVFDPFNPSIVSTLPLGGLAQGIFVNGNYAYLANGENGLEIIDISDVNSPFLVSNLNVEGFASSIFADDIYIYLTDKENGFHVIDISDHSAPYILGTVALTTQPVSVHFSGSYAFVADNEGLKIIQVLP